MEADQMSQPPSAEIQAEREMRERFELAALTGLLANPRYTKSCRGELTQPLTDARRYAAEMVRMKRTQPIPVT